MHVLNFGFGLKEHCPIMIGAFLATKLGTGIEIKTEFKFKRANRLAYLLSSRLSSRLPSR